MAVELRPFRSAAPAAAPPVLRPLGDVERYLDNPSLETVGKDERLLRRSRSLCPPLALMFVGLLARLWHLQIATTHEHLEQARLNRVRSIPVPPPRGVIFDRHQQPLATSVAHYNAAIVPAELQRAETTFALLGSLLKMRPVNVGALLADKARRGGYRPVPIKKRLTPAEMAALEENRIRLPGVIVEPELVRRYLHGSMAAHVLGYVGEVDEDELNDRNADSRIAPGDLTGKVGVERKYDRFLLGDKGSLLVETDARGNPIRRVGERQERIGGSVTLTLDASLQAEAESALQTMGHAGAVVIMRVRDGEILAIASSPTYDPNVFSPPVKRGAWSKLAGNRERPLVNRAVTGRYPPGSTFKLITAAAALDLGILRPTDTFVCDGALTLGSRDFKCTGHHGAVNLEQALSLSCNVYFMNVGRQVGETRLAEYARRFHLGRSTGIDLPSESRGLVPDPLWKQSRFRESPKDPTEWYPGDTLNMAIGQGFVLVTPLQMACVVSAVANGGLVPTPHLLKTVKNAMGDTEAQFTTQTDPTGIRPGAFELIRRGMRQAVLGGTCSALNTPVVQIGAKTGSSQNTQGPKTHAWVASFAPYERPEIVCVVLMENAGHGGHAAAPVARRLLEAAFAKRVSSMPDLGASSGGVLRRHFDDVR